MEFKIFNGTPHVVNILATTNVTFDKAQRKYIAQGEVETIETIESDDLLNASFQTVNCLPINGIKTQIRSVVKVDALPAGYDYYIVSAMFASAMSILGKKTDNLLTVGDPVFKVESDDRMSVIGTLSLNRN